MQKSLNQILALLLLILFQTTVKAQPNQVTPYDIGSPDLIDIYVDYNSGNDSNSGNSAGNALRTVTAAWNQIPQSQTLSQGYRILLAPGTYPEDSLPNYWENRHGSYQAPIIFQASQGAGTVIFGGDINLYDSRYIYFLDLNVVPDPAGDAFHCELCDHILLRGVTLSGGNREAHETLKVNQSQYFYIEDSDISGADDNAIDFVAVQYGHIYRSRIHNAQDWCVYNKGGSAYITLESNEIYDCGVGGFTAGQGTGFEFMTSPWLHYEAYDIKFVNNIVHDTEGAGFGVNGGYNIAFLYNTLYRVGSRSHLIEVVFGLRSCDGNTSACSSRIAEGGWGTSQTGTEGEPIPNRNILIANNLIYNPSDTEASQHFAIYGPRTPNSGTNIPSPSRTDTNLSIRGNVIWNGSNATPTGIEEDSEGCRDSNSSCNLAQLLADNTINQFEPALRDPEAGDFRPVAEGNLFGAAAISIPAFAGGDREASPLAPEGNLTNTVERDFSGTVRDALDPVGAYASSDSELSNQAPALSNARISKRKLKRRKRLTLSVSASDDNAVSRVYATIGTVQVELQSNGESYQAEWKVKGRPGKRAVVFYAVDDAGLTNSLSAGNFKIVK